MTLLIKKPRLAGLFFAHWFLLSGFFHAGYELETVKPIREELKTPLTLNIKGEPRQCL